MQTQPAEAVEDDVHGFLRVAGYIRVLDAQYERAAVVAGVKPVEKRSARATDVKEAGGRGCESDA